ncbi:helix-turn-helix transcriptional regulator [Actinoplanes flavus]|nr:LuxR C-terminal-related transcriptional regulator [Actinoplanes flavus]
MTETDVREALDQLFELSLIRASADRPDGLHVISPEVGLQQALARQQAELARRQQQVVECQSAVMQLIDDFGAARQDTAGSTVRAFVGMDAVRDKLDQLGREAQFEILTFMPGGAQSPAALEHAQRNDLSLLRRGVRLRGIGLDSIRNDAATLAHAQFLTDNGGDFRTTPTLPPRMILADRRAALVPIDPHNSRKGVLELTGSGIVMPMLALFDQIWELATPFGATNDPDREGLTKQEQVLLQLLAQGLTDEAAATRLGVSQRTARRMMSGLMERLEARSRFEAGLKAAQRGWL